MDGLGIHISRFVTLREQRQNPREHDIKQHLQWFCEFARIMLGYASPLLHFVALKNGLIVCRKIKKRYIDRIEGRTAHYLVKPGQKIGRVRLDCI